MAGDGSIKITIEVDGKQIEVASKALDQLEASANKTGKGVKTAETSVDGLSNSSSKASKDVKGAADSVEGLASSGNKASKDLKNADSAIDGVASSSAGATKDVKGTADGIDHLADSGTKASKGLKDTDGAIDDVASSSSAATKDVKGTADGISDLGDSGTKAGKGLHEVDGAIDDVSSSSSSATKDVGSAADSLQDLGTSGSRASSEVGEADGAIDQLADSARNADGNIDEVGDSLNNLGDRADRAADDVRDADNALDDVDSGSRRASLSIKDLVVSMGLVALASKAFDVMKSALDGAISRFDTLAGFPVVMELMGFSSEEASASISKLSDGIQGLPTTLNGIVASTQNIALLTGDLEMATDTALALNNAFLASGSSAADAERGLVQYVQMLSKGSVDLQSWKTLQETMGYALNEAAAAFGFAGEAARTEFYEALKYGEVSFSDFNEKLIELSNATGGFADTAATSSEGIATSLGNLKNAVTVGVANIITSFDKLSQATTGKSIYKNLDSLKVVVNSAFKVMGGAIEAAAPIVIGFTGAVKATIPVVQALSPLIIGLAAGFVAYTAATKAAAALTAFWTALRTAQATIIAAQTANKTLTVLTLAQTTAQIASSSATYADAAARVAQTSTISLSTLAFGLLTGNITLSTLAQIAGTAASYAFGVAIKFLLGPIGWITAGIGLLVTGIIGLVKWFNKSTEEGAKLNKKNEELADSTNELKDALDDSSHAYEKNTKKIDTSAEANEQLAKKIQELAAKEKLSGEEKKELNSYIDQLNRNVDGLNLAYGEETKALSSSSEQIQNRINLMKEEEKLHAAQERLNEVYEEQIEIGNKIGDVTKLREEANQKMEEGTIKAREHKEELAKLDEMEKLLMEAATANGEERVRIEAEIAEASKRATAAMEEDIGQQARMYETLNDAAKKSVDSMKEKWDDYASSATDMFNKLSEKSEVSVSEMTANLEENQRVITNWSANIATLAERGVDEGLLNTLREAGPESAGHVNALVNASDTELEKLSEVFSEGGDVATKALAESLGIEDSGILEEVGHLVIGTEQALSDSIAAADFKGVGASVGEGLAEGIEGGSGEVEGAAEGLAVDAITSAQMALDTNSPSKKFITIGESIPDGLVVGIDGGAGKVTTAIQNMLSKVQSDSTAKFSEITKGYDTAVKQIETTLSKLPTIVQNSMKTSLDGLKNSSQSAINILKDMDKGYKDAVTSIETTLGKLDPVTRQAMTNMINAIRSGSMTQLATLRMTAQQSVAAFSGMPAQFSSIGVNAMAGLNAGLNAGRGRVLATARGIANQVANTMKSALQIHSPSRLMRDDIGKMIPAGIAVGIEENAESVYKALDRLSDGMMITSTPEATLGVSSMVGNAMTVDVSGSSINRGAPTKSESIGDVNNKQPAIINLYVGSKKVASEIVDDITNLQDRKSNRKRKGPRTGGSFA